MSLYHVSIDWSPHIAPQGQKGGQIMIVRVYVRGTDRATGYPVKWLIYEGYMSLAAIRHTQADGYIIEAAERGAIA